MKWEALCAVKTMARALAVAAAVALLSGTPAHALNPIMHNNSTTTAVGSPSKYGSWGNTPSSKYGQFTCTTCHTAGLSGGNAKQIRPVISIAGGPSATGAVVFGSYTSYGSDTGHATSKDVCEVCHSQTSHHRYDNSANGTNHKGNVDCTSCHLHSNGFSAGGESPGGVSCDGCHNDLYLNGSLYGMHSKTDGMSYKHYMDNAFTTSDPLLTGGTLGKSWYATNIPDSSGVTAVNLTARRCLMCHVDHDQFKTNRAFNLRPNVTSVPTAGNNRDDNLCLSCHTTEKTKAYMGPNGETKVMPIPYQGLSYGNATSILNKSTHGYETLTTYADGSTFKAVCVKCHNDSIGKNGESAKSSATGQKGTYKFGEHNSTVPGRFSIFSNDFYQRPATGTTLTLNSTNNTVQVVPSPGWGADDFLGHFMVVTNGAGANQRALITTNTADTLTLLTWPTGLGATASFDVTDDNLSIDNVCFNCHSHNGQGKANGDKLDWYGQQPITDTLEKIFDLFVGDSGTITSVSRKTSVTVKLTQNTWNITNGSPTDIRGYILKAPGGSRAISTITAGPTASGNLYSYTLTIAPQLTSGAGSVQIMKPSSHPLDTFARHESDERVNTAIGWNKGDQGTTATATSATAATGITDLNTVKLWSGSEFAGLPITFPSIFDASGNRVSRTIIGGAAGIVTWTTPVSGLNTAGGDNYYIGNRHVSCGDCHNTHASFKNPEGTVTTGGTSSTTVTDSGLVNVPGWFDNIWSGYLLKVRSAAGSEQIRYITSFSKATGVYTVSLPFTGTIDNTFTYEVMMGDKWSAAGQSGGRAGSGSSGVWGNMITGGWTTGFTRANGAGAGGSLVNTANLVLNKIENVFDNTGTIGGNANAGQRDLCVRCHSYYSYGTATPMTPSGNANGTAVRSTDTAAEFNPNNVAHHAVYARGNNQPIQPTGTIAGATSYYTTNWPVYSTGTVTIDTNGTASITGGALRSTVLPGWYLYRGALTANKPPTTATTGWYQISTITSSTSFTVTPAPATTQSGTYAVTAGLGNAFVPPYGPWSILRCTDCHGSTKTDPVGPHASVNKWLLKDADTALKFEWDNGTAVAPVDYAAKLDNGAGLTSGALSATDKAYFCFNCHRADVYGSVATALGKRTPTQTSLSRVSHGQMWAADGSNIGLTGSGANAVRWPQYCRHCHGGDKLGGIHGSNAARVVGDAVPQSIRFLNGATWTSGIKIAASGGSCYTKAATSNVSDCSQHSGGRAATFTIQYPYTGY